VYNFLLVINSNLGPISHPYWGTATYWPKIANFAHPLLFSALVRGDRLRIYGKVPKTRVFQAAEGEDWVILSCTVFDWSTRVTDGQTDRQTKLRWLRRAENTCHFNFLNSSVKYWPILIIFGTRHHEETRRKWPHLAHLT